MKSKAECEAMRKIIVLTPIRRLLQLFFVSFHHGFCRTLKIRKFCKKKFLIAILNRNKNLYNVIQCYLQCNPLNIIELKAITVNFIEALKIVNYFLQNMFFHSKCSCRYAHLLDQKRKIP